MREIKFRGQTFDTPPRWVFGDLYHYTTGEPAINYPLGKLGDIAYEYSLAIFDGVIETFSVIGNIHDNPGLLERKP